MGLALLFLYWIAIIRTKVTTISERKFDMNSNYKELKKSLYKIKKDKHMPLFEKDIKMKEMIYKFYNSGKISDSEILKVKYKLSNKNRMRDLYKIPIIISLLLTIITVNNFFVLKWGGEKIIQPFQLPFTLYVKPMKESIDSASEQFNDYIDMAKESQDYEKIELYTKIKDNSLKSAAMSYILLIIISTIICFIVIAFWVLIISEIKYLGESLTFYFSQNYDLINYELSVINDTFKKKEIIYCKNHHLITLDSQSCNQEKPSGSKTTNTKKTKKDN